MVRPRPMICLFRPCALTTMLTQTDDTTRACYAACRSLTPLVKSGRELQRFEPESDTLREGGKHLVMIISATSMKCMKHRSYGLFCFWVLLSCVFKGKIHGGKAGSLCGVR